MINVHYLKILTPVFIDIKKGVKEFETKNDENFQVGDTLIFEELEPTRGKHTGAWMPKSITYIHDDETQENVTLGMKDIKF